MSSTLLADDPASGLRFRTERPVDFVHRKGGSGERYLVETMGSGLALFDVDGDTDLDLYLIQGAPLRGADAFDSRNRLYLNDGKGVFTDATSESTAPDNRYGMGCAIGDIDGDGDLDLYVTNFGRNSLYRNDGGRFVDITVQAGVGDERWGSSAAFTDFDNDGRLDLYVANYLEFTIDAHKNCSLGKGIPAYCSPDAYPGVADRLYRNLGDGKFEDVSIRAGIDKFLGKSLGVLCGDVDRNGWIDIYIANDGVANQLLMNRGGWKFEDQTLLSGTGYNDDGLAQAGMGIAGGDFDGDGEFDLFVTNLSGETNALYRSLSGGFFEDATLASRVGAPSFLYTGFGTNAADFDGDGDLDLFVTNGHVIDNIARFSDHQTYQQVDQLLSNDGAGKFTDLSATSFGSQQQAAGRGSVVGDIDGDGDLDIIATNCEGTPCLYRNQAVRDRGWLVVLPLSRAGQPDHRGVRVRVEVNGRRIEREGFGGGSYLSAGPPGLHFGIGGASKVDRLTVHWPDGRVRTLENIDANRVVRVARPIE